MRGRKDGAGTTNHIWNGASRSYRSGERECISHASPARRGRRPGTASSSSPTADACRHRGDRVRSRAARRRPDHPCSVRDLPVTTRRLSGSVSAEVTGGQVSGRRRSAAARRRPTSRPRVPELGPSSISVEGSPLDAGGHQGATSRCALRGRPQRSCLRRAVGRRRGRRCRAGGQLQIGIAAEDGLQHHAGLIGPPPVDGPLTSALAAMRSTVMLS